MGVTGLYQGRPLSEQSIRSSGDFAAADFVDRDPLLNDRIGTGVALGDLVNPVIVEEVGHHCGLPDDEMQAVENDIR